MMAVGTVGTCAAEDMRRQREKFAKGLPSPHMNVSAFVMHTMLAKQWGKPSGCFCIHCRAEAMAGRSGALLACSCRPLYSCGHCGAALTSFGERVSCLVCQDVTCSTCPPVWACECGNEGEGCEFCNILAGTPWDAGPSGWTCYRPYPSGEDD